tara:strand:+ start:202 stop:381 length:180 start_codon:yes stop_codon:yes gene_type:complete
MESRMRLIGAFISFLLRGIPLATTDPAKDPDMDNLLKLFVGGAVVGILVMAVAEIGGIK